MKSTLQKKQHSDEKLEQFRIFFEEAEEQYNNKDISYFDYIVWKDKYETERENNRNLFSRSFEKTDNAQVNAILSSADAMFFTGLVITTIGAVALLVKGSFLIGESLINDEQGHGVWR